MHLISGYELWDNAAPYEGQRVVWMNGRHVEASAFDMPSVVSTRIMHGVRVEDLTIRMLFDHGTDILTVGLEDDELRWYLWRKTGLDTRLIGAWCALHQEGVPDFVTKAHAMGVAAGYGEPVFVLLDANREPSYYID